MSLPSHGSCADHHALTMPEHTIAFEDGYIALNGAGDGDRQRPVLLDANRHGLPLACMGRGKATGVPCDVQYEKMG